MSIEYCNAEGREEVDENLIFEAYERMRVLEEKSVRETKRVRRAKQRRAHHQQAERPTTVVHAAFGPQSLGQTTDIDDVPQIEPFEELEELP